MTAIGWHEARARSFGAARPVGIEQVDLSNAIGRVSAGDLLALTDLPAHQSSAMDGWAVRGHGPWRIVGDVRAGNVHAPLLHDGEAVTIATGAVVPDGAYAVVRSEYGRVEADLLEADVHPGSHIRPAGEEAVAGDVIMRSGTLLTPLHIGLAAAAGHDRITVRKRPRVRIAIFGDELLRAGRSQGGRIRDSLGPQLPAWLAAWGCEVTEVRFVPDTIEAHLDALRVDDHEQIDIVITTGGTAHGPVDFLHAAIKKSGGELVVDSVDCRPGHPMLSARWSTNHLIGLPGNPQAAIAALHTLGAPLLRACLGMSLPALPTVRFTSTANRRGRETRLIPCVLNDGTATPVEHIGSGMLRGLTLADGFAVLTADSEPRDSESAEWIALQQL